MNDKTRLELCDLLNHLQQLYLETSMIIEDIRGTIYNSDEEYDYEDKRYRNNE